MSGDSVSHSCSSSLYNHIEGFVLCCQKGRQSEEGNIAKKAYCAASCKCVRREIEIHRPIPLLELQYWSELSAPPQNYPKHLCCCCCCSACPKEVTVGVRGNKGIAFEVGCSFPRYFDKYRLETKLDTFVSWPHTKKSRRSILYELLSNTWFWNIQ